MHIAILICIVGIALLALLIRRVPTYSVTSCDIPEIISQLDRSSKEEHFAVLMFVPPNSTDGESVNLQYSIEGGVVGMDWILLGKRNIADRKELVEFASKLGYRLDEHEMNGVHYLRVVNSDISELGAKIIQDFYHIGPSTKLDMITEGFKWQPKGQAAAK